MEDNPIDPLELQVQEALGTMSLAEIFLERVKQEVEPLPRYRSFDDGNLYAQQVDATLAKVKEIGEQMAENIPDHYTNVIEFTWNSRLLEDWSGGGFYDSSNIDIEKLYTIIGLDHLLIPGLVSLKIMKEFNTSYE